MGLAEHRCPLTPPQLVLALVVCLTIAKSAAGSPVAVPALSYELVRAAKEVQAALKQDLVLIMLGCAHTPRLIQPRHLGGVSMLWTCDFAQCLGNHQRTPTTRPCPLTQSEPAGAVMVVLDDVSCPGYSCSLGMRAKLREQAASMGAQVLAVVSESDHRLQLDVLSLSPRLPLPPMSSYIQATQHHTGTVFQGIYDNFNWTAEGRGSGSGSTIPYTVNIRRYLTTTVRKYNIRSILDAPNGGMLWMPLVLEELGAQLEQYTGLDIAHNVVARHHREFFRQTKWDFFCVDVCQQRLLPGYDLIFSRDALQHLPYSYVFQFLRNVKESGAKWLIVGSYLQHHENRDIPVGHYYRINLLDPPFNCSAPVEIFDENTPDDEKKYALLYDVASMKCADGEFL